MPIAQAIAQAILLEKFHDYRLIRKNRETFPPHTHDLRYTVYRRDINFMNSKIFGP